MIYKQIHLKDYYPLKTDPILEVMVFESFDKKIAKRKAMIVVPGGGYTSLSKREADPIAVAFMNRNYSTFVFHYSVDPINNTVSYPIQPLELLAAIDYVRKNSDQYLVDENKITVIGFSAGGHLAGSVGFLYKNEELLNQLKLTKEEVKPNALALCYPVITLLENTHAGTANTITGKRDYLYRDLSIQLHVDKDYPPTFLWATKEDEAVPVINTIMMDEALTKANVNHQMVLYEHGRHGLSLANEITDETGFFYCSEATDWVDRCDNFLKELLE